MTRQIQTGTAQRKSPPVIQILADLISCDTEYDDDLSYCLITLNAAQLGRLLDAHRRWQAAFPDALELVLEDADGIAQFLSEDADSRLSLKGDEKFRVITGASDLIECDESDNSGTAWNINLRKIIIRAADVRVAGLYDYNYYLQNAFTASQMIPLDTLRELYNQSFAEEKGA